MSDSARRTRCWCSPVRGSPSGGSRTPTSWSSPTSAATRRACRAKAPFVGLVTAGIVIVAAVGLLPILTSALVGAGILVAARVLTYGEARDAIDLDVIILVAAAFGLGAAIESSGLALTIATTFTETFSSWGSTGIVLGIVLATVLLTEVVTNNAAAAVVLPIALSIAGEAGLDQRAVAIAVAIAASASFVTPIGYQTNTMVYGPGGYRFTDYARTGWPVTVAVVLGLTVLGTAFA